MLKIARALVQAGLIAIIIPGAAFAKSQVIMMLHPGVDEVIGSSITSVNKSEKEISVPVLLPKEAVRFNANEGVEDEQLIGTEDGLTAVIPATEKKLVDVRFFVPTKNGATLTFTGVRDTSLSLIAPTKLRLVSEDLSEPSPIALTRSGVEQNVWQVDLPKGQTISVNVSGEYSGRGVFWLLGAVTGVMLLSSLLVAFKRRPKIN